MAQTRSNIAELDPIWSRIREEAEADWSRATVEWEKAKVEMQATMEQMRAEAQAYQLKAMEEVKAHGGVPVDDS